MKLLLIEDDPNKAKQLMDFVSESLVGSSIALRKSYQSGLKEIKNCDFDFVLLDMQLPTFDIGSGEDGYKFRKLAGIDILNELKRKAIKSNVIIITQFETFGEGEYFITLKDLKVLLKRQYKENYIDTIYYNPSQSKWKLELMQLIQKG